MRVEQEFRGVPGVILFASGIPGPRVAVVGIVHGNELVGEQVLEHLEPVVTRHLVRGELLLVHANLQARAENRRHTVDGVDLNRLFSPTTQRALMQRPQAELCYEEQRSLLLTPLISDCDAVLDLHSTSRPSPPTLVFRDDQRHARIARRLGVPYLITGLFHGDILSGGMCPNAGLEPGERSDRVGLTFEAGMHTDAENVERALEVTLRFLGLMDIWRDAPLPVAGGGRVFEVVDRMLQSPEGATPYRFVGYVGGEPGSIRRGPPRMLASFEKIEPDEIILRRGETEVVRAQGPFTMLLPTPAADPGTDLFYFTQERHGGEEAGEPRTNDQAVQEAAAIERMMDILADDDFSRGTTFVSFHARQILDVCADMIGRALRLPVGHPHRKITVVGSGDFGGDEQERRAGQGYRHAMRLAMAAGIEIDRVQLLRGATFDWLDTLTSSTVLEMVTQRADPAPVRLTLSVNQPHTTSILVIGDLPHALATGNIRHVRAAVVIEAAMVEPDGAGVYTRVVRSAMFSNRREFLGTVRGRLDALKKEHDALMATPLGQDPAIHALLDTDGRIEARPVPKKLSELRRSLRRLQLRLWCDTLRHEVPHPVFLADDKALGRWLAATMASTGIRDASTLRELLVVAEGGGYRVDPLRIEGAENLSPARTAPREMPRVSLQRPILSSEVKADNFERWIGWKRFVRGIKPIPGERGKDLELAFTEREIQRRASGLFRRARRMAQKAPGDVMVVVAGDGLSPLRERSGEAWDVVMAHRALLRDGNVRYLRVQHSRGAHLSWIKDFADTLASRPAGQPVTIAWEAEHGSVVNLVLICVREATNDREPDALDGWRVTHCGLFLTDLTKTGGGYQVALFTGEAGAATSHRETVNLELLHFGRSHCAGLIRQASHRLFTPARSKPTSAVEEVGEVVVSQIESWLGRVRAGDPVLLGPSPPSEKVAAWIHEQLGIADPVLAQGLARHRRTQVDAGVAAREIWDGVQAWPGPLWEQLRYVD